MIQLRLLRCKKMNDMIFVKGHYTYITKTFSERCNVLVIKNFERSKTGPDDFEYSFDNGRTWYTQYTTINEEISGKINDTTPITPIVDDDNVLIKSSDSTIKHISSSLPPPKKSPEILIVGDVGMGSFTGLTAASSHAQEVRLINIEDCSLSKRTAIDCLEKTNKVKTVFDFITNPQHSNDESSSSLSDDNNIKSNNKFEIFSTKQLLD